MLMFIFSVDINILVFLVVPCNSHHSIYSDPSAKTLGTEGAPPSAASCWTEDWNQVPWKYLHPGIIFTPWKYSPGAVRCPGGCQAGHLVSHPSRR